MAGRQARSASRGPAAALSFTVSRSQAVRMLGISDRTFTRLESEGVLSALRPGRGGRPSAYDAYALVRAYREHREEQIRGSIDSPRDRRDLSQAELNELRLVRERRQVLPREQVIAEGQAFVKAVGVKLRQLAVRLERAGAIPPSAVGLLQELLREAGEEILRWSNQLDLLAAVDDEGEGPASVRRERGR